MDRRFYTRTRVEAPSYFVIDGSKNSNCEFEGVIEDISEGGIKIRIDGYEYADIVASIKEGNVISFQGCDEYKMCNETREEIIQGDVKVIRVVEGNNALIFGCKLVRLLPELEKYILDREVASFLSSVC